MPIPRKEFDKTIDTLSAEVLRFSKSHIDTLSAEVLRFLKSHADEAFDIEEIAEAVGGRQIEVWAILDDLKRAKQVSGKCIKGNGYYCVGK